MPISWAFNRLVCLPIRMALSKWFGNEPTNLETACFKQNPPSVAPASEMLALLPWPVYLEGLEGTKICNSARLLSQGDQLYPRLKAANPTFLHLNFFRKMLKPILHSASRCTKIWEEDIANAKCKEWACSELGKRKQNEAFLLQMRFAFQCVLKQKGSFRTATLRTSTKAIKPCKHLVSCRKRIAPETPETEDRHQDFNCHHLRRLHLSTDVHKPKVCSRPASTPAKQKWKSAMIIKPSRNSNNQQANDKNPACWHNHLDNKSINYQQDVRGTKSRMRSDKRVNWKHLLNALIDAFDALIAS